MAGCENNLRYRGYVVHVTCRTEGESLWIAHFRVRGKLGAIYHGDGPAHSERLQAKASATELGCRYIDALVDEVPLSASAAQWTLSIR